MNLYCFDVDGTLDVSQGPVKVTTLEKLAELGHMVVIVSPSVQGATLPFLHINGPDRGENLRLAKETFPGASEYVYVSDNGDQEIAEKQGYSFYHPTAFNP